MHIRVLAVGDRQPAWVNLAFDDYAARLPRVWKFRLDTIATARRGKKTAPPGQAISQECQNLLASIHKDEQAILLDERGSTVNSKQLVKKLDGWQRDGRNVCLLIGGPDGVTDAVRQRADTTLSLSALTLPHGLVRVLLAEQLYRAATLQTGHPYHRD